MDLDLRKVRYFVAVAERLHFGQAAAALNLAQPSLSRQIRQLEHDIGVELLTRSSREVALTPAGELLLVDGRRLLASSEALQDRVRRAGSGDRSLTVGFILGADLSPALRVFTERRPEVSVELERLRWWNQSEALLEGRVDVGFVRLPLASAGLTVVPLYMEQIKVALPADHRLAGQAEVRIAELADEPVLRYADASAAWNAFWCLEPRPDGSQPRHGPLIHDMEEILEYVRTGRGLVFLPAPVARSFPRTDIVYVPVADAPKGQIALAWDASRPTALVIGLAEAAREGRTGDPDC